MAAPWLLCPTEVGVGRGWSPLHWGRGWGTGSLDAASETVLPENGSPEKAFFFHSVFLYFHFFLQKKLLRNDLELLAKSAFCRYVEKALVITPAALCSKEERGVPAVPHSHRDRWV